MKNGSNSVLGARFASIMLLIISAAISTNGQVANTDSNRNESNPAVASTSGIETKAVEQIVRDYLLRNPEVVREALIALQVKEEKEMQEQSAKVLKDLSHEIYSDPDSPVTGNPKGDVSIVVFFDYNCGYCKSVLPQLQTLSESDSLVKIIYKEMPILGPQSRIFALAALAAGRQGKYVEFHNALLEAEMLNEESIKEISTRLGLDHATLENDMADPKLAEQIEQNLRLSTSLYLDGTPAYIIGDQIIRGALDAVTIADIVANTRAESAEANKAETKASALK